MSGSVGYLVAAVLAVAAAIVGAVLARRRAAGSDPLPGPGHPGDDPRRLKPGDVVEIRRVRHPVRGSVHLVEGEWSWAVHLLDADGPKRWISVGEDPELELLLWAAEPGAKLAPGAPALDFAGRRYSWAESGQARYSATGDTGLDPSGTVRYHDYRAADGSRLAFEAYGESGWEVARGERLRRAEVTVHPRN
ncbi:DUF4178 domain-containing protein [Micromonospora sp. NPDC000089]|uniref:DUF4178 domain-containing protein n=1 Tax=unclassified Micromonospora TaxID=2617518 RepID=UPI003697EDBE